MFFSLIDTALDPMLAAWNYLSTTKTQADISNTMTTAAAGIRTTVGSYNGVIDSLAGTFSVREMKLYRRRVRRIR